MKCPNCNTELSPVVTVPDQQKCTFRIEHKGHTISSKTVSEFIKRCDAVLVSVAKDLNANVATMISGIEFSEGNISITFDIVRIGK